MLSLIDLPRGMNTSSEDSTMSIETEYLYILLCDSN
jgi:hypothetical protein